MSRGVVVGVDASRNRSGGAIRHLVGILGAGDPREHGVDRVHLWAYDRLLEAVPNAPWLEKHSPAALRGSIFRQALWQRRTLPAEARATGVDIMLNTDAGTVFRAHPAVTMSRDMLSYEPGEMKRYGLSKMTLRLLALRYVQVGSLRDADGAIFLTRYAANVIQKFSGPLRRTAIVPHGISAEFRQPRKLQNDGPIRCIYVSQTDLYKHQWHVVRAIADLRALGHDVTLTLAGGGEGKAERMLMEEVRRSDPRGRFVILQGFVRADDLPALLADHDLFIFASSCENMPNTLLEGMAAGMPIACARRGPMPEVLRDGGVYFDPEDPATIAEAVGNLLADPELSDRLARRAAELSAEYSWQRCAAETWKFLRETLNDVSGARATQDAALQPVTE